jgi:hypothetical protein
MLAQTDKRSDERVASNTPIIFSWFSTRFWKEYSSMTRNHSKRGMCFESGHLLTPGAHLFIRVDEDPDSNSGVRLRNSILAVVKWCRKLTDEHATGYCIGARYYKNPWAAELTLIADK